MSIGRCPFSHTWRTKSTTVFNPMKRLKDGGDTTKKTDYETKPQGSNHFYAIH